MLRNRFARRLAVLEARHAPPFRGTGPGLSTEALAASLASCQDVEEPLDLAAEVEVLERRRQELEVELKEASAC